MAGHSQFANIKHRKERQDKKRAKIFTRLIRDISTAARMGGGDTDGNPALRKAVDEARVENMPKDTIERAIKRGTGEIEGADYEEVVYEGYGPGNVALMVKCLTDNRTRTVANIRAAFNKNGGRFGETVNWMFEPKGIIWYPAQKDDEEPIKEDEIMEAAIEGGAEDVTSDSHGHQIVSEVEDYGNLLKVLTEAFGKPEEADLGYIPTQQQPVGDEETAQSLFKLINALEDDDDVQTVTSNVDMPDDIAQQLAS